jgi:hypothetical protein
MKRNLFAILKSVAMPVVLLAASTSVMALEVKMDSFAVDRVGGFSFDDEFTSGGPPPSAPNLSTGSAASYVNVTGSMTESGGKLTINTSTAPITTNAVGNSVRTAKATLATNDVSTNTTNGLKSNMSFDVMGRFDLTNLAVGESFGVRFVDRGSPLGGSASATNSDDFVQMQLQGTASGSIIRFAHQDFVSGTSDTWWSTSLASALGSTVTDQISLGIERVHVVGGTSYLNYGYCFLACDLDASWQVYTKDADLFHGESYTRAEFFVSAPVPEPESYAMMLAGLGFLGWVGRRRKKETA